MVNYKLIADEASKYDNYQAAFTAMSTEEKDNYKELSSNNLREWATANSSDFNLIKNNTDSVVCEMAMKQIDIDSSPLDMRKPSVRGFVDLLPISPEGKLSILAMATIKVKVWAGLKAGHVQNALQKRAEGKV